MSPHPEDNSPAALRAKRRMSYYLLAFLLIMFIQAGITFPFVDHTTRFQNIVYGIIVTAPFIIINVAFIILTGRDLKKASTPPSSF